MCTSCPLPQHRPDSSHLWLPFLGFPNTQGRVWNTWFCRSIVCKLRCADVRDFLKRSWAQIILREFSSRPWTAMFSVLKLTCLRRHTWEGGAHCFSSTFLFIIALFSLYNNKAYSHPPGMLCVALLPLNVKSTNPQRSTWNTNAGVDRRNYSKENSKAYTRKVIFQFFAFNKLKEDLSDRLLKITSDDKLWLFLAILWKELK